MVHVQSRDGFPGKKPPCSLLDLRKCQNWALKKEKKCALLINPNTDDTEYVTSTKFEDILIGIKVLPTNPC